VTDAELKDIVLREYAYWRDVEPSSEDGQAAAIGAMGAAANIFAAALGHAVERPGLDRLEGVTVMPAEVKVYGRHWFGVIRIRILLGGGDWRTTWELCLPFGWSFGVKFPARLVRLFGGE
jgi:hypothetical protein